MTRVAGLMYVSVKQWEEQKERIAELEGQLPEGMEGCAIEFRECAAGHGRLVATNWIDHGCQHCRIAELEAERDGLRDAYDCMKSTADRLKAERDALKQEAQGWAQEARTQRTTVAECYQAVTGAMGEPGDWNGATPVRDRIAELEAERDLIAEDARLERDRVCVCSNYARSWHQPGWKWCPNCGGKLEVAPRD